MMSAVFAQEIRLTWGHSDANFPSSDDFDKHHHRAPRSLRFPMRLEVSGISHRHPYSGWSLYSDKLNRNFCWFWSESSSTQLATSHQMNGIYSGNWKGSEDDSLQLIQKINQKLKLECWRMWHLHVAGDERIIIIQHYDDWLASDR